MRAPEQLWVVNHEAPVPVDLRGAVVVLGNFDGIHIGHRVLVERARAMADQRGVPLALMSSEPHPKQFLNPGIVPFRLTSRAGKRLNFLAHRIELLYEPSFDVEFATRSPQRFVEEILRDYLGVSSVVVGNDFRFGHKRAGDVAMLTDLGRTNGFDVEAIDDVQIDSTRVSSTLIRKWIGEGLLDAATEALCGTWLTSASIVEDGYVLFESHQLLPPPGEYQVMVLDRQGNPLGFEILTISPSRHAHLATNRVAPGSHLLTGWRRADFS